MSVNDVLERIETLRQFYFQAEAAIAVKEAELMTAQNDMAKIVAELKELGVSEDAI